LVEKTLVAIIVSKDNDELLYRLDCSPELTMLELEFYLEKIVEGICKWKPSIYEETLKSFRGTTQKKQIKKTFA
jgi:hypothetical protein